MIDIVDDGRVRTITFQRPEAKNAMNTEMWDHPVTQRNRRWLEEMGRYTVVEPADKQLACGDVGPGGLAEPTDLLAAITQAKRSDAGE